MTRLLDDVWNVIDKANAMAEKQLRVQRQTMCRQSTLNHFIQSGLSDAIGVNKLNRGESGHGQP